MTDTLTVFPFRNPRSLVIGFLVVVGLYLTSLYHYLLFHSISELFSIVIACAFFMIAWNSRDLAEDSYLVYLGIAYLFIAVLDLLHTLSYKGMNIFQDYDFYANQLWIAGRYMESVTLLIFWGMAGRRRRVAYGPVFAVYTAVTAVLIATVFYWKVFPVCFVEGEGLAHFIRELRGSLAERRRRLGEDGRVMSKTLSHVNEILHLQRRYARESGGGPGTDRLDMAELIDDALAMQAAGLRKRGITVRRHYPPGLHGISGDRTRLIQVFMNLIKNAAEALGARASSPATSGWGAGFQPAKCRGRPPVQRLGQWPGPPR